MTAKCSCCFRRCFEIGMSLFGSVNSFLRCCLFLLFGSLCSPDDPLISLAWASRDSSSRLCGGSGLGFGEQRDHCRLAHGVGRPSASKTTYSSSRASSSDPTQNGHSSPSSAPLSSKFSPYAATGWSAPSAAPPCFYSSTVSWQATQFLAP